MKNNLFVVDVKGFRQLQEGKSKTKIIRELLQNCMDEPITKCNVVLNYKNGKAHIKIEDDSPIGFRNLSDCYTLFADTYKRADATKRGRFNSGEKEVLVLADYATIISTTGGYEFDVLKGERKTLRKKREKGSEVYIVVKMTREEYEECVAYVHQLILPTGIEAVITSDGNEITLAKWETHKIFSAKLPTELKENDRLRIVQRETEVHIYKPINETAYIYELGIPVCEIDCPYSIDIQQKVPLSNDRDKVEQKYLKDLFALVLNNTIEEVSTDDISQTWIRNAMDSDKVAAETVSEVKDKRYGDKAVIFNPFDENANDEALSRGYRLIYGNEMGSSEWDKMKQHGGLVSSTALFGKTPMDCDRLPMEKHHEGVVSLSKRLAKDYGRYDLTVEFIKERAISAAASFGGNTLTFNLARLGKDFFMPDESGYVKQNTMDLILHELGHKGGNHTEHSYHDYLTGLGAWAIKKAITNGNYFKL